MNTINNNPITRVIFRMWENDIIAIFPDQIHSEGFLTSYQHIGQHSACSPSLVHSGRKATQEEYASLHRELTEIGYNLLVCSKMPRKRLAPNRFELDTLRDICNANDCDMETLINAMMNNIVRESLSNQIRYLKTGELPS